MTEARLTEFEKLFMSFQYRISQEWNKRLSPVLSPSQGTILLMLKKDGKKKITELAEELVITPGAITSLSVKLIANEYAVRTKDEHDRRVVYLEITDKGKELLEIYLKELKNTINYFFSGLKEEELELLSTIFEKILINIEKEKEEEIK